MKSILSFFASIIIFICISLDIPCYPMGEKLDMNKFGAEPTFSDEFDGESRKISARIHSEQKLITIQ